MGAKSRFLLQLVGAALAASVWLLSGATVAGLQGGPAGSELRPAADLMAAGIADRLGSDVSVSLTDVYVPGPVTEVRDARPAPDGRLGKPMRFTLIAPNGTTVIAVATVHVVVRHAVTRRALRRNTTITADDVEEVTAELVDAPLRRPQTVAELIGGRVLRPLDAGVVVQPGTVVVRRPVEPGDRVVVVALSGPIEVTAEMVAADGGAIGDLVRAVNPETRRYVRGRVVQHGRLEVMYGR